jgi:transposase-like protein
MSRVEVISGLERRRRWSEERKRTIVAEAFAPGASVSAVARRTDIGTGQIYRWRRELCDAVAGFAQVVVAPPPSESFNEIATVRIELRYTDPLIWRQVEVPTSITLKVLHDIIQAVIGWCDCHLWEFTIGKQRYVPPILMDDSWGTAPLIAADKVRLRDVLKPRKTVIDYLYDMGDSWEHRLTVTGVRAGEPGVSYPRYIGGERNGPPEDCCGIPGFYELLEVLGDPAHPDHAFLKQWQATTIPIRSTRFRSNTPSAASQTVATPAEYASPRKNTPPQPDHREKTRRGPYRTVTVNLSATNRLTACTRVRFVLREQT